MPTLAPADLDPDLLDAATRAKAWPFEEARKLVKRIEKSGKTDPVVFQTGYGPSGLPHIGTFGEVARTTMVRHAFHVLTGGKVETRLIAFSDDMDGMRKVPGNVPNQDMLEAHLGKPLTVVPSPFSNEHQSFAHHNNAKLRAFLDGFGFDYEFASATDYYKSGKFDDMLVRTLERYQKIMDIMLPTLGEERQATYSPILPISPTTGRVLYVPMKEVNPADATVTFEDEDGRDVTLDVRGGNVKLQWKPDFGMRWAALDVDFEMFGKDHQNNSVIYDRICKALGGTPPEHYVFELFLDDKGEKISKTKGNGISIDEWLNYASPESLALFMFQKPRTAKRLYFDVIPRAVDEYFQHLGAFERQDANQKLGNPAYHIHAGDPQPVELPVNFSMLLNLASAANAHDEDVLWGFISRYAEGLKKGDNPTFDALVGSAVRYFEDRVAPNKKYRAPSDEEQAALQDLDAKLADLQGADAQTLQGAVYEVGRTHFPDPNKPNKDGTPGVSVTWFSALYQILLGEEKGPRFGSFVELYGVPETRALIAKARAGDLVG
ncbi:lysine--tRNA ligase [Ahrensia marina]|uniref:lysine--tRNA ligase n=1 Tax=Ahrensia marina TaxID=1514904 RepID=UPI0035CE9FA2